MKLLRYLWESRPRIGVIVADGIAPLDELANFLKYGRSQRQGPLRLIGAIESRVDAATMLTRELS